MHYNVPIAGIPPRTKDAGVSFGKNTMKIPFTRWEISGIFWDDFTLWHWWQMDSPFESRAAAEYYGHWECATLNILWWEIQLIVPVKADE
jgi:hypothetical protein